MRNQKSRTHTSARISRQRFQRFSLCSRKKKEGVVQGKLRIRSVPGAFLVLGVVVVIIGTMLAVAGYWPYRVQRSALGTVGDSLSGQGQASGWGLGAKDLYSTSSLIHSERMKLLGPVIMGVGLFILICANTVLYENRDRETQMLLAQMRSVICSVSTAVPSADLTQVNTLARHYQLVSGMPAAHLNILCLQELASSEPLLQVKTTEEEGDSQQKPVLCTEVLHHQESSSTCSNHTSNSCHSTTIDLSILSNAKHPSSYAEPQPESHCKLRNCLSASSMSTLEGEDWGLTTLPPKRSLSLCYRTNPHTKPRTVLHLEERAVLSRCHPNQLPRQSSSQAFVEQTVLNLNSSSVEGERHCSWPRLDLGYARKYLKLDNKEDSVDKLLDQLEQQCLQLDMSFGSGPFQ